jgi:hypothetical protein
MSTTEVNGANIRNAYTSLAGVAARQTALDQSTTDAGTAIWSGNGLTKFQMTFVDQPISGVAELGAGTAPAVQQLVLSSGIGTKQAKEVGNRIVINGIHTPLSSDEAAVQHTAASKSYVDGKISQSDMGISWKNAVQYRTVKVVDDEGIVTHSGDLSNSWAGIAAKYEIQSDGRHTLTAQHADHLLGDDNSATGLDAHVADLNSSSVWATTDGVPTRILVMNQEDPRENGIYEITRLHAAVSGATGLGWQLTRAPDANDVQGAGDLRRAAVYVDKGLKYGGTGYVESGTWTGETVLGSTTAAPGPNIEFALMANISSVHADDGLKLEGRHIKINVGTGTDTMKIDNDVLVVNKIDTGNLVDDAVKSDALSSKDFVEGEVEGGLNDAARAVGPTHIKSDAIQSRHIGGGQVDHNAISSYTDNALDSPEALAAGNTKRSIMSKHIRDVQIMARHIITDTITGKGALVPSSGERNLIRALTITGGDAGNIAHNTITGGDGGNIASQTISGINGVDGNILAGSIENGAMAEDSIDLINIADNAISSAELAGALGVGALSIRKGVVGDTPSYNTAAIVGAHIQSAQIANRHLGANAISSATTTGAAGAGALSIRKGVLGDSPSYNTAAIVGAHIQSAQIATRHMQTGAINNAKLLGATGTGLSTNYTECAVSNNKIQSGVIDARTIITDTITGFGALVPSSGERNLIRALTITGGAAGNIASQTISGINGDDGNILAGSIEHLAMANNSIRVTHIANNAISSAELAGVAGVGALSIRKGVVGDTPSYNTAAIVGDHIQSAQIANRHLVKGLDEGSTPWSTAAIVGAHIQSAQITTRHLVEGTSGDSPSWSTATIIGSHIQSKMIGNRHLVKGIIGDSPSWSTAAIEGDHIQSAQIKTRHLVEGADGDSPSWSTATIIGSHIQSSQIQSRHISGHAVFTEGYSGVGSQTRGTRTHSGAGGIVGAITEFKIAEFAIAEHHIKNKCIKSFHLGGSGNNGHADPTAMATGDYTRAVDTKNILDNAVIGRIIADEAVTGDKIKKGTADDKDSDDEPAAWSKATITSDHIQSDKILARHISPLNVTAAKLSGSVTTISGVEVGQQCAVTNAKIADSAIDNRTIGDRVITNDKLYTTRTPGPSVDGAISGKMISEDHIEYKSIKGSWASMGDGVLDTRGHIQYRTITAHEMGSAAVETRVLDSGAVTSDKLSKSISSTVDADGNGGNLTRAVSETHIQSHAVKGSATSSEGVDFSKIAPASIGSIDIADGAITTDHDNNTSKLSAGCILAEHIKHAQITDLHVNFANLNVEGTVHANAIILGGSGSGQGTINLAKVKSVITTFDLPSPQKLYLDGTETTLSYAKGWWTSWGKHVGVGTGVGPADPGATNRTSLLEWNDRAQPAQGIEYDASYSTALAVGDGLVVNNPGSTSSIPLTADNVPTGMATVSGTLSENASLYTQFGMWAAGWSLPTTTSVDAVGDVISGAPTGNIYEEGSLINKTLPTSPPRIVRVPNSNAAIGGSTGHLGFTVAEQIRGLLVMWSCTVRTAGFQPATIIAKTYISTRKVSDDTPFPLAEDPPTTALPSDGTNLVDTQTIYTDVATGSTAFTSIVHTKLSGQTTYIDVESEAAGQGVYIENVWVELSYPRPVPTSIGGAWLSETKAIIPNGSSFNLLGLIISDGSTDASSTAATYEHTGVNSTLQLKA